jgi:hypothetical protein
VLKRSSKSKGGRLPTALKLKSIKRVERGEGVLPVAREMGVTRKNGDASLFHKYYSSELVCPLNKYFNTHLKTLCQFFCNFFADFTAAIQDF